MIQLAAPSMISPRPTTIFQSVYKSGSFIHSLSRD
jgi:hypothetical protein